MATVAPLKKVKRKDQNYNTEFRLYPQARREPEFTVQPLETFRQFTWISSFTGSSYDFVKINQTTPTINMLEGTEFGISSFIRDPSNMLNPAYDKNITYIWRRDGSPLYEINRQNNVRGAKSFYVSGSDCRRDLSGTYQLEARNRYGSAFSEPFELNIIDKKFHPFLFNNLIVNPCGAKGLEGWVGDGDFKVDEFSFDNRTQWSIPGEVYKPQTSPYVEQFNFSFYPNETRLSHWFEKTKDPSNFDPSNPLSGYNRWIISNFQPNIVDTDDHGWGNWASFFPSWDYLDGVNKNDTRYQLKDIVSRSKTYFTRDKIKFTIYGGNPKCQAYQDIDVSEAASLIDGETYGVDRIVAHFFAYIGVGISKYNVKYIDELNDKQRDNTIPLTWDLYLSGAYAPQTTKPVLIPLYTGSAPTPLDCHCCGDKGLNGPFVYTLNGEPIDINPVTDDITDIRLDFLDASEGLIDSKLLKGPDDRDIWAVKEKFFVPYYLGNLYSWMFDCKDEEFNIYNQRYTTMNAIRGVDDTGSLSDKDINAAWMQEYHYPLYDKLSDEYLRVNKSDRGAAAMFGINENVVVPKGTRTIRVNIIFNHNSNTIFDTNPRIKDWDDQEIYYDYYTNAQTSQRLFEYGNPRCGVTGMHLSLHPNNVQISKDYNTYLVPLGNVWYKRRAELGLVDKFWTVTNQGTPVSSLQYVDIRPDTIITFANQSFAGPTSVYNLAQQLGATGLNVALLPAAVVGTATSVGQIVINQIVSNQAVVADPTGWDDFNWQVLKDGVFLGIINATGSSYVLPNNSPLSGFQFRVRATLTTGEFAFSNIVTLQNL